MSIYLTVTVGMSLNWFKKLWYSTHKSRMSSIQKTKNENENTTTTKNKNTTKKVQGYYHKRTIIIIAQGLNAFLQLKT